jgi:hypothetical protein
MRRALLPASALAVAALAACGGGGGGTGGVDGGVDAGPLAPPAVGMQLATTPITLAAGQQQYACWSFPIPQGQPYPIVGIEQQIPSPGVHHFAVFTSSDPAGSYTPASWGACQGTNDPNCFDCSQMGAAWGLVTAGGVGTPPVQFPSGTSMTLNLQNPPPQGQTPITQIIFQLHLLNATPQAIDLPAAFVNLVSTTQAVSNFQQVGLLIAGTLSIDIPAGASNYQVSGGCGGSLTNAGGNSPNMPNIFAVFPHMHQLGTNIEVTLTPQGSTTPNVLVNRAWNFGEQGLYPVTGSANAGDQVQVTCTYDNTTGSPVSFGLTTQDEMCFGVLFYYPADPTQTSQYCGFGD